MSDLETALSIMKSLLLSDFVATNDAQESALRNVRDFVTAREAPQHTAYTSQLDKDEIKGESDGTQLD